MSQEQPADEEPKGPIAASDVKRLPDGVVSRIRINELQLKCAQLEHEKLLMLVEREYGFKFDDVTIAMDGTIAPKS